MKTIAIVGAGPGLGLSLAKIFGKHDYQVALIARNKDKLDIYVQELKDFGVIAAAFPADVLDQEALKNALTKVKETFGGVDVLEYSPVPVTDVVPILDVTADNATLQFNHQVVGAITSVRAVLPEMMKQRSGAILFTTGMSAIKPVAMFGNVGLAMSALRNYAYALHDGVAEKGVYVGTLSIGIYMQKGHPENDQDLVAARIYDMCEKRDRVEETFPIDVLHDHS